MKKTHGPKHTGKMHRGVMHLHSHGGGHMGNATHGEFNKKHGTPGSFTPEECYQGGEGSANAKCSGTGGHKIADNEEQED